MKTPGIQITWPGDPLLMELREEALAALRPSCLLKGILKPSQRDAFLYWGKVSLPMFKALADQGIPNSPGLVVSPEIHEQEWAFGSRFVTGEHPIPGLGSLAAGEAILEFFEYLGRVGTKRLNVLLSGGASSLAWIPPVSLSTAQLGKKLELLYRQPLSIQQLNQERAKLCVLKSGGAARWLGRLAPRVSTRVLAVSDVSPFGPEVIGSGPFAQPGIPHRVMADNASLMRQIEDAAKKRGLTTLEKHSLPPLDWRAWVQIIARATRERSENRPGLLMFGGEPMIRLPRSSKSSCGGRQTQIAAALLLELWDGLADGRLELIALSSDGSDGNSRSGGACIGANQMRLAKRGRFRSHLIQAVRRYESAHEIYGLGAIGALIPEGATGTNVQDVLLVRILN